MIGSASDGSNRGLERSQILVVDDDPFIRTFVSHILKPHFQVIAVRNALKARSLMVRLPFDVVLTDHDMPHRTGLWLLRWVREHHPRTRRMLMSGSDRRFLHGKLPEGLAQVFIAKPFDGNTLVAAVHDVLRREGHRPHLRCTLQAREDQSRADGTVKGELHE